MRQRFTLLAAVVVAGCANILGIDDGTPRSDDASSMDVVAPDVAPDVPMMVEAGVDAPPFSPLSCDTKTCNFALGETCCRTGPAAFTCVDAGGTCKGTPIPCDRPDQCKPGDAGPVECCTTDVLTDAGYVATSVSCMTKAQCSPVPIHYILCGDGDASADCPDGNTCTQSTSTLPPFLICR